MIRFRPLAILSGAVLALGIHATESRAGYLVQVTSTLVTPIGANVLAGNSVTLNSFLDNPAATNFGSAAAPVNEAFGTTSIDSIGASPSFFSLAVSFTLVFSATGGTDSNTYSLSETGTLSGYVGPNVDTLTFTPSAGAPLQFGSYTALSDIGGETVFARLAPYTPPGSPPTTAVANFDVQMYSTAVPEPSSLALCGIAGVIGLIVQRGRRKRVA